MASRGFDYLTPPTMSKPNGYSHAVRIRKGATVFIAGQVALDQSGNLVGKGDFRLQAQQAFANLKAAVEAAGGTMQDIVKLNVYVTDIAQLPTYRQVRDLYIDGKEPPTSTAIQVSSLFRPEFLIEVDAAAVVPENQ